LPGTRSRTAAVVLNYQTYSSTITCVEHLLRSADIAKVFVVDNASPDGSAVRLARHFADGRFALEPFDAPNGRTGAVAAGSEVELIVAEANGGYGAGNNLGLRAARRAGFDTALVLNPDVVIEPPAISAMLAELGGQTAVVVPVLWNDEAKTQLECFGAARYRPGTTRRLTARTAADAAAGDFFTGACFVADLGALESAGWLAEHYFLYYEELDLTQRLRACGYGWRVAADAWALHYRGESVGSASTLGKQSVLSSYYGTRSAIVYTRQWERRWVVPATLARVARGLALLPRSPRHGRAVLRGVKDAWRTGAPQGAGSGNASSL